MNNTYRRFGQMLGVGAVGMVAIVGFLGVGSAEAMTMVPTMNWVYPNADMEFEMGRTYTLQWTGIDPTNDGYEVVLGLERVGSPTPFAPGYPGQIAIGSRLPLSGSFNWRAGYADVRGTQMMEEGEYRLVVVFYSFTQNEVLARDYSDGIITLTSTPSQPGAVITAPAALPPSVLVAGPQGNNGHFLIGSTTTLAWEIVNPVTQNSIVSLGIERVGHQYTVNSLGVLGNGTRFPLSGTYEWTVGATGPDGTTIMPPGEYRFVAVLYSFTENRDLARDYSDETFFIDAVDAAPPVDAIDAPPVDEPSEPEPVDGSEDTSQDGEEDTPQSPPDAPDGHTTTQQSTVSLSTVPQTIAPPARSAEDDIRDILENRLRELTKQLEELRTSRDAKTAPASLRESGNVPSSAAPLFARTLRFGMRNDTDVRTLQELLTRDGVYMEGITGNFLGLTRKAVIAFQEKYGIEPASGFVGPLTREKLRELTAR